MCKSYRSFGTCVLASPPEEMTAGNCMSPTFSSSGRSLLPVKMKKIKMSKIRHSLHMRKSNEFAVIDKRTTNRSLKRNTSL